jgi:preprotein translocase subunit SecF
MFRILHDTNYDFIKWWKQGLFIRIAFIVIGLGFLATHDMDWSIEFTGGTLMQVQFATPPGADAVRAAAAAAGHPEAEIQEFGVPTDYTIKAQLRANAAGDSAVAAGQDVTRREIEAALHQRFGDTTQVKVLRAEFVGPTVGAELRRNAMLAVLVAFVVTLAYLAFRFEWRFGVAAVVANAHEVFATFAFLALMRLEFSLEVLAAILTVIGYSLNDTIIIFDRVRENLRRNRKEPFRDVINRSINETLPRSVLTHVTVLAATLALLFFAGPVIRPFAWIMTFGVTTATFTSIYISGALLLGIEQRYPRNPDSKGARASIPVRDTARASARA